MRDEFGSLSSEWLSPYRTLPARSVVEGGHGRGRYESRPQHAGGFGTANGLVLVICLATRLGGTCRVVTGERLYKSLSP